MGDVGGCFKTKVGEAGMVTDNDKLHATHRMAERYEEFSCGGITRGDGQRLRRCRQHSNSYSLSGRQVTFGQ